MRELTNTQRQIGENPGLLGELHDYHHADKEADGRPVDGLDCFVEIHYPYDDDKAGSNQGDFGPVYPLERERQERAAKY
jgi:hypothetical protein